MTAWTVPAEVLGVHDGDSIRLRLDLGWHITLVSNCRLLGVDTPELWTDEGKATRDYVSGLLPPGTLVMFRSERLDKYGRPLGTIALPDGRDLTTVLIEGGYGKPYDGGKRG